MKALLLSWLVVVGPLAAAQQNVLVLFADDLGQRDLGCYNPETFYETPNLDNLSKSGVRFSNGYSACPVCSPTRYSLVTGKWPARSGITNYIGGERVERFAPAPYTKALPGSETTMAESLKAFGYQTTYVGKWHLGGNESDWPEHHGFDRNAGGFAAGHPKSWFSPYGNPRLTDGPDGEFLTERLARETIASLKAAKESGKPFYICHAFYQVHTPLKAPAHLVKKYEEKRLKLGLEDRFGTEVQYQVKDKSPRRVRETQAHAVYAAMVESMDTAAGQILRALEDLDLAANTLVIFTSDNGGLSTSEGLPTSNLPWRAGKGWTYEGGIRVPFIMRWPTKGVTNKVEDTPISTIDVLPTALAIAGQKAAGVDGVDLSPLLRGESLPARDLFWHYPHYANQGGVPGGVIRSGEWKLLENYEDGSVELYNLAKDPGEREDLAAQQPERVTAMRGKLHTWYRETGAKFLQAKEGGPKPWSPGE
ncbi:MAG: sulfatase [Verrucomicrobiales bacterium]